MNPLGQRAGRALADLRRRSDELKDRGKELARRSDKLGRKTEQVRQDWRRKRADPGVPGAVPERQDEDHPSEPPEGT